jgi:hypothetical protein
MGRRKTIRLMLREFDNSFRKYLLEEVLDHDVRFEYMVTRNELQATQNAARNEYAYTDKHLNTVQVLLAKTRDFFLAPHGLTLSAIVPVQQEGTEGLRLEFRYADRVTPWIRIWLVRLGHQYNAKLEHAVGFLVNKQVDRNFVFLIRPVKVFKEWEERRKGQIRTHLLTPSDETTFQTIMRLLEKRPQYEELKQEANGETRDLWQDVSKVFAEEFALTYLAKVFQFARTTLDNLSASVPASEPADEGSQAKVQS